MLATPGILRGRPDRGREQVVRGARVRRGVPRPGGGQGVPTGVLAPDGSPVMLGWPYGGLNGRYPDEAAAIAHEHAGWVKPAVCAGQAGPRGRQRAPRIVLRAARCSHAAVAPPVASLRLEVQGPHAAVELVLDLPHGRRAERGRVPVGAAEQVVDR